MASAARGGTTRTPARRATCRRTSTRSRSPRTPTGPGSSRQPEILAYLERLRRALRHRRPPPLRHRRRRARAFDEDTGTWQPALRRRRRRRGRRARRRDRGSSTGRASRTSPASTTSRPPVPLGPLGPRPRPRGRDVAVIGNGASAVQFVPEIAKQARSVTLFQRSSNFVGPKPDGPISDRARALMRRFTVAERAYRASIWVRFDARFAIFKSGSRVGKMFQRALREGPRGDGVAGAEPRGADAGLPDRLQAHPDLERLVPDARCEPHVTVDHRRPSSA